MFIHFEPHRFQQEYSPETLISLTTIQLIPTANVFNNPLRLLPVR